MPLNVANALPQSLERSPFIAASCNCSGRGYTSAKLQAMSARLANRFRTYDLR